MSERAPAEWRCPNCSTLLGKILPSQKIEIAYKGVQYCIKGEISAVCRRCHATVARNSTP